jgi:hypothetical protein
MQHGIQEHVLHTRIILRDTPRMRSATALAGLLPRHGRIVFDEKGKITAGGVKFANLLADAGTVNGIRFMH